MTAETSFKQQIIGGVKATLGLAAVAFAALMVAPFATQTSDGANAAQSKAAVQSEYFPNGYVNQAVKVEQPVETF